MIEPKKQLKITRIAILKIVAALVIWLISLIYAFWGGRMLELAIHQGVLTKISDVNACIGRLKDV